MNCSVVSIRRSIVVGVLLGAATTMVAASPAPANHGIDTGDITVPASTRAVELEVLGFTVSVDKVSDPTIRVSLIPNTSVPRLTQSTYPAGQNNCAADDNPSEGTLNRSIWADVDAGGSATTYAKVQYQRTSPQGTTTTHRLEPFGAYPGQTMALPVSVAGDPVQVARICVS